MTAVITYPSLYEGDLSLGIITEFIEDKLTTEKDKVVLCKEDADEEIQREHVHIYWDSVKQKQCTTKHFDIPLSEPFIVYIRKDKTRYYKRFSELGIDSLQDPKLARVLEQEEEDVIKKDVLTHAHPNIQLKKEWGDKYFMLRYVTKRLHQCTARSNFDVESELNKLEKDKIELDKKKDQLINESILSEINVGTMEELIELLKKYKKNKKNKNGTKSKSKSGNKTTGKNMDDDYEEFHEWLRKKVLLNKLTKNEILYDIENSTQWWNIYCKNYVNYNKLVNDMFKGRPPAKPKSNYDFIFWLPNKLYNYIMWLDEWVRKWYQGEELESRPMGLCLIGDSKSCKTSLMSLIGSFSYIKNVWSMDCWESKTSYTIMDDLDAGDEGKGLSFCWYKPFFGAQDAITITDKFKPKQDIYNGKPLIWLNNYKIEETFQSKTAQRYIAKNMNIVYLTKPLNIEPKGMEIYQYKKFDPKTTWYYNNVINPRPGPPGPDEHPDDNKENMEPILNCMDNVKTDELNFTYYELKCKYCKEIYYIRNDTDTSKWECDICGKKEYILNDFYDDENEPLEKRKRRLSIEAESKEKFEKEKGRLTKRARRENTSITGTTLST